VSPGCWFVGGCTGSVFGFAVGVVLGFVALFEFAGVTLALLDTGGFALGAEVSGAGFGCVLPGDPTGATGRKALGFGFVALGAAVEWVRPKAGLCGAPCAPNAPPVLTGAVTVPAGAVV